MSSASGKCRSILRSFLSNNQKLKFSTRFASSDQGKQFRFDGQTALITGAGRGLGREYALLLASRGANVVVNDFGGSRSGDQDQELDSNKNAADLVVEEINKLYPESKTEANYDSVSCQKGVKRMVEQAHEAFGSKRIDILINNAGILRDKSFVKMTIDDWDQVHNIHLRGSFLLSHACWPIMRQQSYGKIVMTSSTSGLYGNFGQANYSAAKMGLIGLSNTLAIEGKSKNIFCNTIVPMAISRMTSDILPEDLAKRLKPSYVAPLVVYLCHKDCLTSGSIIEASGRWFGRYKLQRSSGKYLANVCETNSSLELMSQNWQDICDNFPPQATQVDWSFNDHLADIMRIFEQNKE